jgi:hypothetical protein
MIENEERCPFGHKKIDFVNLGHRSYVFCYDCNKRFVQEDYNNGVEND